MKVTWRDPNTTVFLIIIVGAFGLFFVIVLNKFGGDQALFSILGYVAGWASAVSVFFTRKSPPSDGGQNPPTTKTSAGG